MSHEPLTSAEASRRAARRTSDLIRRLETDIDLAHLTPGESLPLSALARRLRCRLQDLPPVVAEFAGRGLLALDGERCVVAPVQRDLLLPMLDHRLELELRIVERAAERAAPLDEAEVADALEFLGRSALLGDIDGYMAADRRLDHAYFAAADLPEVAAEITAMKREFRRAWCAFNRLRDLNQPAGIRREVGQAILARRPDVASLQVRAFFNYLRVSY